MKKTFIFSIHSIAGLVAGVFILLLSVSGTILVFSDELDNLQKPSLAKQNQSFSIDSCYYAVKLAYPKAEIGSCNLPEHQSAISFFLYDSVFNNGTAPQQVFVNQYTKKIMGSRGSDVQHNFTGWLSKFHNSFNAGKKGEWLLGVIALIFAVSLLTGIVMYRKSIIDVLLFKRSIYTRKNRHQLIGVFALLFNLLMAITGLWMQRYVFKKDFYAVDAWVKKIKPSPPLFFSMDAAFKEAKTTHPNFTPYIIYFAQSPKSKTAVYGSNSTNSFIHSKKLADVIVFDSSGTIAATRFVNENTPSDYYDIVNSQLHMGRYGGWFIKLLYGLFGISGAILSITGFLLWLKRMRKHSK